MEKRLYTVFHHYRTPSVIVVKLLNKSVEVDETLHKG